MLPIVQFRGRSGLIDLAWGHPHPSALPVATWPQAYAEALRDHGPAALTYGRGPGPGPLVDWLCDRLGRTDGRRPAPDELFVTAGASAGLELVTALLVRPGDAVLVDSPTYHLALRILADHTDHLVPAPVDSAGIDPVATAGLVRQLRAAGRRVPMLYLVPTFDNPTGRCLPVPRRAALVELAARTGLTIVEDDTYHELAYDAPAPTSLHAIAADRPLNPIVRLGSFAKTVAPGLRLGWLTAAPPLVRALADRGFVDSGGGVNHATALAMAAFGTSGRYDQHLAQVCARYRAHRDRLVAAVRQHLPAASFDPPAGGWFLWLRLPAGSDTTALLPRAEAAGVSYLDGPRFFRAADAGKEYLRLSFSMLEPDLLDEGVRRLATAVTADPAG